MIQQNSKDVCQLCGKRAFRLERAHIVDRTANGGSSKVNLLLCCPSCHSTFDNVLKPKLYKALRNAKVQKLPRFVRKFLRHEECDIPEPDSVPSLFPGRYLLRYLRLRRQ